MAHPTQKEIAERTGFSIATVSRALAGSPLISARTRREVMACARETGYRDEVCREVAVIMPDVPSAPISGRCCISFRRS